MPAEEPDRYSLDEMMNRLRSQGQGSSDGEPELVTRADGSQAMRVRKRKRRSRQPHKEAEKRRRKRSLVVAGVLLALVMVLALVVLGWFLYLNAAGYRDKVAARAQEWSGAEVTLTSFRATPVSVGAAKAEFVWPEDAVASRLTLHGVVGDLKLSSHLTGEWHGREILARNGGELVLRHAREGGDSALREGPAGSVPFRTAFRSPKLRVAFGEGERPAMAIHDAKASFMVPDPSQRTGNLVLEGGRTRVPGWGVFQVRFASLRLDGDQVSLGNLQLVPEGSPDAEIRLIGEEMPPLKPRGGESEFRLRLEEVPSSVLLGGGLEKIVIGVFESLEPEHNKGLLFVDVTDPSSLRFETPIRSSLTSGVRVQGLGLFQELADVLGIEGLAEPKFDSEGRAVLTRDANSVRLDEIDFVAQGSIRLRGGIQVGSRGELSGILEVGLPEATVMAAGKASVRRVFSRRDLGWQWASVSLTGTTTSPTHNLRALLSQQGGVTGPTDAGGDDARDFDAEFRELTTPGGSD